MKTLHKPWIKLKETIDSEDYDLINKLQEQCIREDKTTLKLELDYKLRATSESGKSLNINNVNEFMYFDEQQLIGYIGICSFGGSGSPIEANGMVHPEYRRQGVFKTLSELAIAEFKRRKSSSMLLLSDKKSNSGQKFIEGTGAEYKHTEYEMYLKEGNSQPNQKQLLGITFRKATNSDAREIARQNAIYFSSVFENPQNTSNDYKLDSTSQEVLVPNEDLILPEEEEKRGMTIYLAEKDQEIIGKAHVQLNSGIGGIYGLGVLPQHRGKGFGRAILLLAIEKLKEANANQVMLQVEAKNANALNLYKSCGFIETSTMDYFEIKLRS